MMIMYAAKNADAIARRYVDYIQNAIRKSSFNENDERAVRGLFVAARRAMGLKGLVRRLHLHEQREIVRRVDAQDGWTKSDQELLAHTRKLVSLTEDSLANLGSMVAIVAGMLDGVTTPETRAALLDLSRPDQVPAGATTLQAILCGSAKVVSFWTEYMVRITAEGRWNAPESPLTQPLVALIENQLYRKLPRENSIDAAWRAVPVKEFIYLRRAMRKSHETLQSVLTDRKMADRSIRKLDQEQPMSADSAAKVMNARVLSKAYAEQIKKLRNEIDSLADDMLENTRRLDAVLNFTEKCELFNVNTTDRADLDDDASASLILSGRNHADSAMHRKARCLDHPVGAPLMMAIIRYIEASPGGKEIMQEGLNHFFPGGVLADENVRVLSDGSVMVNGDNTGMKAIRAEAANEAAEQPKAAPRVLH